ncbi:MULTISPECIES: hypothetical protein [Marinobacter]|uniref:Uncharacterized protein n=1 Tax=Marinobacter suaedae TaxID=3057675 RepID=A0ABT8W078_9GAMM|nr:MULTISPECIES: hypothetical protein [unclassified Marinobacter]MDO3721626.1 hypothetical protein [Marinobacter sp. chi1]
MKVMFSAFVAALVIAFAAPMVLNQFGWSVAEQTSSASVRLD